ncbi:MAG: hypothetical protein J2P57_10470 [Acidimicrobiaceae bacterium]|nr:hypothetical protein [Acidimicrobiaceae bacterium]
MNPDEIRVGDELPPFSRSPDLHHWNRFAAVNDEFVPIHMDDEAGRAAGYPSAFGMGNLQFAYLHNLLRAWMGDDGRIVELACQFRAANVKGQTVTARGTVTAVRDEIAERQVDLEVWIEDQGGTRLAPGTATVVFDLEQP